MKNVIFLEQLLEPDVMRMKKWKHFCIENNFSIKGKIPKWFNIVKKEITIEGSREIDKKYKNRLLKRNNINLQLFDENEKVSKNSIVTWNDKDGLPIFGEDKK